MRAPTDLTHGHSIINRTYGTSISTGQHLLLGRTVFDVL